MFEWLLLGYGVLGCFVPLTGLATLGYAFGLGGVGALVWLWQVSRCRVEPEVREVPLAELVGGERR